MIVSCHFESVNYQGYFFFSHFSSIHFSDLALAIQFDREIIKGKNYLHKEFSIPGYFRSLPELYRIRMLGKFEP